MIKFPKMHIAESVMNRIMNAVEGNTPLNAVVSPMEDPSTPPDPAAIGEAIEDGTVAPVPEVSIDPNATPEQTGLLDESLRGGSPFDGMVARQFGGM